MSDERCTKYPGLGIEWSNIPDITDHFHMTAPCDAPLESPIAYVEREVTVEDLDTSREVTGIANVPIYAGDLPVGDAE